VAQVFCPPAQRRREPVVEWFGNTSVRAVFDKSLQALKVSQGVRPFMFGSLCERSFLLVAPAVCGGCTESLHGNVNWGGINC
jgi:hypothetical protein